MKSKQAQLRQAMKLERERKKKIQQQIQTKPKILGILKESTHAKPDCLQNETKSITNDDGKNRDSTKINKVRFDAKTPEVKILIDSHENNPLPKCKNNEENRVSSSHENQSIETSQILDANTEKEFEELLNIEPTFEKEGINDELIHESQKIDSFFQKEKEKVDMEGMNKIENESKEKTKKTNKKKSKKRRLLKSNASDLSDVEQLAYEARLARLMLLSQNNLNVTSTVKEANDLPTLAFNEYTSDGEDPKDEDKLSSEIKVRPFVNETGNLLEKGKDSKKDTELNKSKRNQNQDGNNQNQAESKKRKKVSVLQILQQKRKKARKLAYVAKNEYDEKLDLYSMN